MVADRLRQTLVGAKTTVVVKVGTNVLTNATGELDRQRIESLAGQISHIRAAGHRLVLVSSGAIGAGVGKLGLGKRPTDLPHLQACAAVGQSALMQLYQEALNPYQIHAAQILLTASDFDARVRYLNVRNTISTLFEFHALPIINENDTVSIAEIKFGDNDQLAAMVANLLQAPLLILLTNVDGLYSSDPRTDANAALLASVPHIDATVTGMAGTSKSSLGTGGMKSKLKAARLATAAGGAVIMANGSVDGILDQIFRAEPVGTLFLPHGEAIPAWKRWLGFTAQAKGQLVVDAGAVGAIVQRGTSLLPVGVRAVQGDYGKGDVVTICDASGQEVARGLTNYTAADTRRIMGLSTEQIAQQIGNVPYVELVHRDNLVTTR